MSNVKYQPHIDGLRAIAVISVLIFHINPSWLPGGFIGVDVFFVISGFLITSIINREISNNSFSIANFYNRRIKRILPVYYAVAIFTLGAGFFLFFPSDFLELAQSTIASSLFASNYYFWSTSGYFSKAVELKPLLHTWSLAVEEQFYIFWPLLLLILSRLVTPRIGNILISIVFVISVLVTVLLSKSHPDFAYYSIVTRTFELMIGAMFSIYSIQVKRLPSIINFLAVVFLLLSVTLINKSMLFPGYIALVPCIATGILITKGNESHYLNWILSTKAFVTVGLLSYSLYMWHWPVLAFTRYYYFEPTVINFISAVLVIFLLAHVSRRYIERPFLKKKWEISKSATRLFLVPLGVILVTCLSIIQMNGVPARYDDNELNLINSSKPNSNNCSISIPTGKSNDLCTFAKDPASATLKVAIWGDSHANHFKAMAENLAQQTTYSIELIPFAGCPSIVGVYRINRSYSKKCFSHNKLVWERIEKREFDVLILASNWANYPRGNNLADTKDFTMSISNSERSFYANLELQIDNLISQKQQTIFVDSVPNFNNDPTRCNLNKAIFDSQAKCDINYLSFQNNKSKFTSFINQFSEKHATFKVLKLDSQICDEKCSAQQNGKLIYSDKNHLSEFGSKLVTPYFAESIDELQSQ